MPKPFVWTLLAAFAALSAWAVARLGLPGFLAGAFGAPLHDPAAAQVFADLVLALLLVMAWMWRDARRAGRNPWPWIVATLLAGSFGPLLYLATRKETAQ